MINHVADPRTAMWALARVARSGGYIAATIWPAQRNAWGALVADAFDAAGVIPSPSPRLSPELGFERSVDGLRSLAEAADLQITAATRLQWAWDVSVDALRRGIAGGVVTAGQQFLAQTPAVQTAAEAAFRSAAERLADNGVLRLPSTAAYVVAAA